MDLIKELKAQLETKKELIEILEEYLESFDLDKKYFSNSNYFEQLTSLSLFKMFGDKLRKHKDDADKDFYTEAKKHYKQIVKLRIKELLAEGGVRLRMQGGFDDIHLLNISFYNESVKINQQMPIENNAVKTTHTEDFPIKNIDKWIDDVVLIDGNLRELIDISYYGGF